MNNNFEFTIDQNNYKVQVNITFSVVLAHVWDAFTKTEILDQWWAPKPWKSETKLMEFKQGGQRLYAMVGPKGEKHWAIADFTSISPKTNFKYLDAFTDAHGNISNEMPRSAWSLDFIEDNDTTTVKITIKHQSLADLELLMQMGFKEGFTMALNNLTQILSSTKP